MRSVALVFLTLFLAVAGQTFVWKGGNGVWEDPSKWEPTGYPNAGSHSAVISAAGTYTITHTRFLLVGSLTVTAPGATVVLDQAVGYLVSNTATPPSVTVLGNSVPGTLQVIVRNTAETNSSVSVTLTNLESGQTMILQANSTNVNGTFAVYDFPVVSCLNSTNATGPGVMEATAFDTFRAEYKTGTSVYYGYTQITFTDKYQARLGVNTIGRVLFTRSLEKNLKSLINLRAKLQYIRANLPVYADNHCCQDDSYVYPLNLTALAVSSYRFLTGGPSGRYTTCRTTVGQFCEYVNFQYGNSIGPVTIQWTGLGDTTSWQDKNNWFPRIVPNYPNADVRISPHRPTYIQLEGDTQIRSLSSNQQTTVSENYYYLNVGTGAPLERKYWYGSSGQWQNAARWTPSGVPTDKQHVVTGGFGDISLTDDVSVLHRFDTGASQNGDQMNIQKKGFVYNSVL